MNRQMNLFAEGGMMDDSGDVVNGVEVPPGSLKEEVADDVPARLSEGEFVIPADVVRYIGLEKLMAMRDKAKAGLDRMQDMGQMGNAQEVDNPDQLFSEAEEEDTSGFESEIDSIVSEVDSEPQFARGGFISGQDFSKAPKNPVIDVGYYKHPDGRLMWITKINGKPMSPPPDGFTEVDAEEAKKGGLKQEEKTEEADKEAKKKVETSGDGGNDLPDGGKTGPVAKNITIDPATGKATPKAPPDWLMFVPGGSLIAAGMKGISSMQASQWNEALEKGNIVNATPDRPNAGGWVDITNVENTGYGINVDGKSLSSNVTIGKQDDAIFGGTFDKDGNFVETNADRAAASRSTNVSTSTGGNTADPGMPTGSGYTGGGDGGYGSGTEGYDAGDMGHGGATSGDSGGGGGGGGYSSVTGPGDYGSDPFAKGGLVKKKYPAKKKSKKTGLASK